SGLRVSGAPVTQAEVAAEEDAVVVRREANREVHRVAARGTGKAGDLAQPGRPRAEPARRLEARAPAPLLPGHARELAADEEVAVGTDADDVDGRVGAGVP